VLIIGVGNTAMDCCRTSLRLGAKSVKVMARKPRQFFKASEWELEDAEEENVEIVVNHSPKAFVVENGKLKGMLFDVMEYELDAGPITAERSPARSSSPADDVILAIGQENAFPWIERDLGIEFDKWSVPRSTRRPSSPRAPGCSSAATPRSARRTSSGPSSTATRLRSRSTSTARATRDRALPDGMNLQSRKMGMHEWAYSNDYNRSSAG
jgi:formate dehydrogenase beta subunit